MGNSKWFQSLISRYGSEEAAREKLREWQTKSRQSLSGKKMGFAFIKEHDPEYLVELSRRGVQARQKEKNPS